MPRIQPFVGYLVNPKAAAAVVAPAYDSVSPEMRRKFAQDNPNNFINTMLLREDFPPDAQPTNSQLLELNKAKLAELLDNDFYQEFVQPSLFVYQLKNSIHCQTGLVGEIPISEYRDGK